MNKIQSIKKSVEKLDSAELNLARFKNRIDKAKELHNEIIICENKLQLNYVENEIIKVIYSLAFFFAKFCIYYFSGQ